MKFSKEYEQISQIVNNARNILIVPHIDPDPDGLGASFALAYAFESMGKNCWIGLQEELLERDKEVFPDDSFFIYSPDTDINYDLVIAADIGSYERVGIYLDLFQSNIPSINLDHHIDNNQFADVNIVDVEFSSTSELAYELLRSIGAEINHDIAKSAYIGIVFDTGAFRYSLTTKKTHFYVSELLDYNIDTNDVYEKLFEEVTEAALCIKSKVASSLERYCNGQLAITYLRNSFKEQCQATKSETSGMVKIGSSIKGVDFHIYISEKNENTTKVSLRCKSPFKVNRIAARFGGGGHEKAAGFTVELSFDEVYNLMKKEIVPEYEKFIAGTLC